LTSLSPPNKKRKHNGWRPSLAKKAQEEALYMARLLVSKPDHKLLGATEFEIRDRAHKLAASAIETALNERKKGGTKGPASSVPTAKTTPAS